MSDDGSEYELSNEFKWNKSPDHVEVPAFTQNMIERFATRPQPLS